MSFARAQMGQRELELKLISSYNLLCTRKCHVPPSRFYIYIIPVVATTQVEVLCVISGKKKHPLREVN